MLVEIPIPQLEMDNHGDVFSIHNTDKGFPYEAKKNTCMLEERMGSMEGLGAFGMDLVDLGLVPDIRVPAKFKVPEFDKNKGTTYPKTHTGAYYRKMFAYSDDEKVVDAFFQDSLSGALLE